MSSGVFDVHKISSTPFTCGSINTLHGFLLLEAFHYALSQVNSKKGQFANILPDVKLGGIGIDACDSEIRGSYLVSNINNGMTTLARDGIVIDPAKIDAYIGSYGSRASIYLARVLTDLKIPQVCVSFFFHGNNAKIFTFSSFVLAFFFPEPSCFSSGRKHLK